MIQIIKDQLQNLDPTFLEVEDYSHQHSRGENSHFKVVIVSDVFKNKTLVEQHQMVYQALNDWLNNPIHGLSIHSFDNQQWQKNAKTFAPASCRGGG